MKTLLWLDDVRNPLKNDWLNFSPILKPFNCVWVKSYNEFIDWITANGLPDAICFDHDLHPEHYAPREIWEYQHKVHERMNFFKEKSGYDCAKWLIDYCRNNNLPLPEYNVQTANPVGKQKIINALEGFKKVQKSDL